ncbi:MAG: S1 family peptidase [Nonomuraea sp.]|nr:S1 family peptidase [Nonomuraea sp.]
MSPGKYIAAGVALAVALLTVPAIASASQAADPPSSPPSQGLVNQLSKDLGISPAQATARLANEHAAAAAEPQLHARLGASYGGAWVAGPTSTLVAATTDAAQLKTINDSGAQAVLVTRTLDQLNGIKAGLDAAKTPKSVRVWYVDVEHNEVVVRTSSPAKAQAWVKAAGVDASAVRVEKSDENPRALYDVRGGDAYYINGNTRCSVGFSVTRGGQGGFVSAGHCGTAGSSTTGSNQVAQGTFQGSSFPGNDYSWVAVNSNWVPRGVVNAYSAGIQPIHGSTVAMRGASVCRAGSTSGYHCGTVQQLNTSVTYQEGTVYEVTMTSVCAEPGDSGGSFFSDDQAQGVTSGGSGNCSSGGTTYFQPVNEILSTYGLTLVTDGGGGPTTPPSSPPPGGTTWAPNTNYATGATVTYAGVQYRCIQGHTSLVGWEPPNVPALWGRI